MYSEQLEAIIDAALADGTLTDKEREVLHKRAAQEGVDADELDVVIEGRLAKMKKEKDWLRPTPPKVSDKIGVVLRCPCCNEPYRPGTVKCEACGYEFINREAVSSATKFAEGLAKATEKATKEKDKNGVIQHAIIENFIISFPLPNTRDDLLEFIASMEARRHNAYESSKYKAKLVEAINKAEMFYPNDPQFKLVIQQIRDKFKEESKQNKKELWYIALFFIGMFLFFILMGYLF